MNIRDRWNLSDVFIQMVSVRKVVERLSHSLKRNRDNLSGTFAELDMALDRVMAAGIEAQDIIDRLLSEEDWTREQSLTAEETERLRHLNRVMNNVSQFMHQTADAIRPKMQAKTADDADPMFDYEIEVKLDYALREDDPEYDEDIDNYPVEHQGRLIYASGSELGTPMSSSTMTSCFDDGVRQQST